MDKYASQGVVGEGTYGMVTKCVNKTTGSTVAIKKLRNTIDSRHRGIIVREISLLRTLDHEHVVPMIETFRDHGYVYMVFPFMRCNLYSYLERNGGRLTVDGTRVCMYQVLKGLNYVHGKNIVHRDIKPENVLMSPAGVIKICDFGGSRLFCADRRSVLSTGMGTVWYMAPEMLMESNDYDTAVDIWSAGVLLTELVNRYPLVTEYTADSQLYGIAKVLNCDSAEITYINRYLHKHGVRADVVPRQGPLSESYVYSDTALALRKACAEWPMSLLEIAVHCLQLNPKNRMNAAQLLDMDFFTFGTFVSEFAKELENKLKRDRNNGTRRE